jgi:hypothetical protein
LQLIDSIEEEIDKAHWEDFSYTREIIKKVTKELREEVEK